MTKEALLNEKQKTVLKALASMSQACGSKEIASIAGMDAKEVSSQLTVLKKKGLADSPARCVYAITDQGRDSLS